MHTTILALLAALWVLFIGVKKILGRRACKTEREVVQLPPGPRPWPVIGNVPEMLWNRPTYKWLHHLMHQLNTDIACFRFGNVHVVPVTCPKIALEFLRKQDAVFASRPTSMAAETLSRGYLTTIITPYGEQWKKMRRVLTLEITKHKWLQENQYKIIVGEADNLVKYIYNKYESSGTVNVRTAARLYCGNLARNLVFGRRYFGKSMPDGGPGIAEEKHVDAVFTAVKYLYAFCISDYLPYLVGLDLDGHEKIVKEAQRTMQEYHDPIIDDRIQQWRRVSNSFQNRKPQDLLDSFITHEGTNGEFLLTPEEIKAQVVEIMIATLDNPSNAVEWILAEMLSQPETLRKAVEELDKVVGKDRLVQEYDIPNLNYIKACIRESFRLHPVLPFNPPHVALSDSNIAGFYIPKGSHIILSRVGLGRNPKTWDEPLKFKPERHINTNSAQVQLVEPDLRFVSFGTGRRGCPANLLGSTMSVMLLARLIHGFIWSLPPSVAKISPIESADSLFLAEPLIARIEPRLPQHLYYSG